MLKPLSRVFSRREILKTLGAGAASLGFASFGAAPAAAAEAPQPRATGAPTGPFSLPDLGYEYKALEPAIDTLTMQIHHQRHHAGYVAKANEVVQGLPELMQKAPEDILKNMRSVPGSIYLDLRNNLGGHVNHSIYWDILTPGGPKNPKGALGSQISKDFGGYDQFIREFADAARTRFGSGWAWLVEYNKKLSIISTANQDSPYMEGYTPILGIDVWEHAYYLQYQNKRSDYVAQVLPLINWDRVGARFTATTKG